jgi:hypothetical protein
LPAAPAFALFLLFLLLHCAEIGPPPGGPEDKYGPELTGSIPANGDVQVAPGRSILIQFSERIRKPRTGKAVFISPQPDLAPEIDWKSDHIEISLPDTFAPDQTYLITISSEVTDIRGNKLDSSLTIAFTTGDSLANGRAAGIVRDTKPVANAVVELYPEGTLYDSTDFPELRPLYRTVCNKEGHFAFSYLPSKRFELLAYVDKSRDDRFTYGKERFALADRAIEPGGAVDIQNLLVPLAEVRAGAVSVVSATHTQNNLVRVRLEDKIPLRQLADNPATITLMSVADSSATYPALGFAESHRDTENILRVFFSDVPTGRYNLTLTWDPALPPARYDSLEVKSIDDTEIPVVESVSPTGRSVPLNDAVPIVRFSEPIDTSRVTGGTVSLWTSDSLAIPVRTQWLNPFQLTMTAGLEPGQSYTLRILEYDIFDLSGNRAGDSLQSYRYTIVDRDSLGTLTGQVRVALPNAESVPVVLVVKNADNARTIRETVLGNIFTVDLPAGKYLLTGFLDRNRNERLDNGSLQPFELPETRATLKDTVVVRARFETAGIELTID